MIGAPVDRSTPPPREPLHRFHFPAFHRARLDNGLRILVARVPRTPLVDLQVMVPAGAQHDPPDVPGLASLHGSLLDEGTAERSALELAGRVEILGGSLGSGAGWNMAYVETGLLSRHLDAGLDLLAEVLRAPAFPETEIDRLKRETQADLMRRKDLPSALADRFFSAAVYRGTVYQWPLIGTEESLERIDRARIRDFYRRHVGAGGSTLIAVGDLDPDEVITRATAAFSDWPAGAIPERPAIEPPVIERTQVHVVDRPGAQTQLQMGHAGVPRNHPDFHRLTLLNTLFGGKFTSRINLNLREEHGYTYGVHSQFVRRQGPGPFLIRTAVGTDVAGAAVREVLGEMRRIRDEKITREELEETRDYLIGVFPYTLQKIDGIAKRLEALTVFGLPLDYYDHFPQVFHEVSREDVQDAARRYLHPDRMAIVVVGPAAELVPQLEDLGPVTVHEP